MSFLKYFVYAQLLIVFVKNEDGYHFHQDLYTVRVDRMDIVYYDKNIFKDVEMKWFDYNANGIQALNASGYLVKELGMEGTVESLKMVSNKFKPIPGRLSGNLCKHYKANSLQCQDFLRNVSNFIGCPLKPGFYYLNNGIMDFSRMPPAMIEGYFKVVVKGYEKDQLIAEGHGYGNITLKSKKRQK